MKSNKNNKLQNYGSTSLVRAGKSISITNKILSEIKVSDLEWWQNLTQEWRNTIYANFKIQVEHPNQRMPYFSFNGDYKKPGVIRLFEELYNESSLAPYNLEEQYLNEILQIEMIDCCETQFEDYSPIKRFGYLKELYLNESNFCTFDEITTILPKLTTIEFNKTKVDSVQKLTHANNLKNLSFYNSNVTNIDPLENLVNLIKLNCSNNNIRDISALQSSKKLLWLDCNSTQIQDINCISNLRIQKLWLSDTKVKDISCLSSMKNSLYWLLIDGCSIGNEALPILKQFDLKWLIISKTNITDISFVKQYSNLERLDINETGIQDFSPLFYIESLLQLGCKKTNISEKDLKKLQEINPNCKIFID